MIKRYGTDRHWTVEHGQFVYYEDHIAEVNALKARIAELEGENKSRYPWHEAPEWAEFGATDEDGESIWFEKEPTRMDSYWHENFCRKIKFATKYYRKCDYWRESLEKRPGT